MRAATEARGWRAEGEKREAPAREEMRPPRRDQLAWVLSGFRAGVDTVCIDVEDFAGFVQRLMAAGALGVEAARYVLETGGIRIGGYGVVRRFEFVKDARLRSEEDREEEIRVAREVQAEWEAWWRSQERAEARR